MSRDRHIACALACVAVSLFVLPAFSPNEVRAQAVDTTSADLRVVDLSADAISSDLENGRRIRRLTGNVVLVEDSTTLRARRATEYVGEDLIVFSDDVSIERVTDTLTASTIRYQRREKVGQASGNVVLRDGDVVVFGPTAQYDSDRRHATFDTGVTLIDSSATLASKYGEYWSREKRALFTRYVELVNDDTVTRADSVEYLRETEIAIARGQVVVVRGDTTGAIADTTWLFTEMLRTDRDGSRFSARDSALLIRVKTDSLESDTLAMRSRRLVSVESDSVETVEAVGDVLIWRGDVAASADSALVTRVTESGGERVERLRLYRDPVLWFGETQISGDSIAVLIRDGEVDSLFVGGRAFLAQEDSVLGRIQQVKGATLQGRLAQGSGSLTFAPDAEALFFNENDGEPDGAMQFVSTSIRLDMADDELRGMHAADGIEGTYYDEEILPVGLALSGLAWRPGTRPTRRIFADDSRVQALVGRSH